MTRAARVATLVATLLASSLPIGPAAHAAPAGAAEAAGIELVSQDPWTPVGGELRIGVRVAASIAEDPNATLLFTALTALRSRSDFDQVIAGDMAGSTLDAVEIPLAFLAADSTGTRVVTLPLEPLGRRDRSRFGLRRPGVYPVAVEVRSSGLDDDRRPSITTFAVVTEAGADGLARPIASRLGVAWVWPLQEGPSTLPDGSHDPDVLRSFNVDGRLGRQAAALTRAGDVRLTLIPGAETLEAWVEHGRTDAGAAQGAAAVLDAAGRTEVLSNTYVPTDVPSLLGADLAHVVDRQLTHGREVLDHLLSAPTVSTTVLARPATDASVAYLQEAGAERVIVDSTRLVPVDADGSTITQPFRVRTNKDIEGGIDAVASDTGMAALLSGQDSPALRAQRLLAALSIVALEAPSATRAVVVASPAELFAPRELFDAVLSGLRGNPWLESMTIGDVFARVPATRGRGLEVRELSPVPVPDPPVPADVYRFTEARVGSFAASVGTDDPITTEAVQALLVAESSSFVGADGLARAAETVADVNDAIDAFLAGIRVPDPGTITLTARSGDIPLTFRNDTGRSIRITITLESPKLAFPEGATQTIEVPPRSTTLRVPVDARTSGTFSLKLSVRAADGGLVIGETRFRVRSTVVSTVGITLMIGAAVFLAVWWGLYIWRARRRRRAGATVDG